ncbi:MAG: WD40/YVTN/BNR-like repeat-containing protein [Gammaproteobacteria bacterium]
MDGLVGTATGVFRIVHGTPGQTLACRNVRDIQDLGVALYAGSAAGVHRSRDGGCSWEPCGLGEREVWQIRAAPDGMLLAVTQPAGLFRSADGGDSWTEVEALTAVPDADSWCVPIEPPLPGRARALVIDATDPARLWVGVEVGGILSSRDAGASWQLVRPGGNPDIHVLVAHPGCADELYVSTGYGRPDGIAPMVEGNAGVFRSTDGGQSWHYVWAGITPRYTRPMCIDPRPPHPLTVACAPSPFSVFTDEGGAGAMLFRSDDRGGHWRSLGDAAHTPSTANFHGLTPAGDECGSVLVGTDTGELWRVSAAGEWRLLVSGLPAVLSVLDRTA